jgi:hypothetical protein
VIRTPFLRTPIRADHQSRLTIVEIDEEPLSGNPAPADPHPQTLKVIFTPASSSTEIQIAPLWEGDLVFIADSTAGYPSQPADVTEANAQNWPLTGDLILVTRDLGGMAAALKKSAPLVDPPPNVVRYSKVVLTNDFLFTTLKQVTRANVVSGGKVIQGSDASFHANLVIKFLLGQASVPCRIDATDPSKDFAAMAMPRIALAANGDTTFRLAMSSRAAVAANWFMARPEDLTIPGTPAVDPSIDSNAAALFNPAHPLHSFVPPSAFFTSVDPNVLMPDHKASPLWAPLSVSGFGYRRIDVIRPPIPGKPVTFFPTRPYPLFQLAWQRLGTTTIDSLRLPLNGRVYALLADASYTVWVSPRNQSPPLVPSDRQFLVSIQQSGKHYIDLASATVTLGLGASVETLTIYAHMLDYDSARVWQAWVDLGMKYVGFMNRAGAAWNVEMHRWAIYVADTPAASSAIKDYSAIHGFIRASAGRHGLAPEFLHAVFMGEDADATVTLMRISQTPFDPTLKLSGYGSLGLDRIWAELPDLVANGYIDALFQAKLTDRDHDGRTNEDGVTVVDSGNAVGWEAAVEFTAATLDARLDQMVGRVGKSRDTIPELQRRWLAYFRFNSYTEVNLQKAAAQVNAQVKAWVGPPPTNPGFDKVSFIALQRLAVSTWYEDAGVYR